MTTLASLIPDPDPLEGITIISTIPEMLGPVLEELGLHTPPPRTQSIQTLSREDFSITEIENTCLLVAWRITREMCILKGLVGDRTRLGEVSFDNLTSTASNFPIDNTPRASTRNFARMELDNKKWTIIPNYSHPEDWIEVASRIGKYLPVMAGGKVQRHAWEWITHPQHIKHALPPFADLVWFEDQIIYSAQKELTRNGTHTVLNKLRETFGIDGIEGMNIVAIAYACVEQLVCTNREQNRAMMVLRLEDYIERARDNVIPDLRAEIYALKQISMIQGLTKAEEDTSQQGIRDALARISDDRRLELEQDDILVEGEAEEIE